jgi:hypothetical protein
MGYDYVDVFGAKLSRLSFSEELGDAEINTWIHRILAPGADSNPGVSPTPLREGVDSTILNCLCQL